MSGWGPTQRPHTSSAQKQIIVKRHDMAGNTKPSVPRTAGSRTWPQYESSCCTKTPQQMRPHNAQTNKPAGADLASAFIHSVYSKCYFCICFQYDTLCGYNRCVCKCICLCYDSHCLSVFPNVQQCAAVHSKASVGLGMLVMCTSLD